MFEKLFKKREDALLLLGNVLVALFVVLSFVWFLSFSMRIINDALTIKITSSQNYQFNVSDFEKVKTFFNRS